MGYTISIDSVTSIKKKNKQKNKCIHANLTLNTGQVLAQTPEPEAHDKVLIIILIELEFENVGFEEKEKPEYLGENL